MAHTTFANKLQALESQCINEIKRAIRRIEEDRIPIPSSIFEIELVEGSGRILAEVSKDYIYDDRGREYDYDTLCSLDLCNVTDYINTL